MVALDFHIISPVARATDSEFGTPDRVLTSRFSYVKCSADGLYNISKRLPPGNPNDYISKTEVTFTIFEQLTGKF